MADFFELLKTRRAVRNYQDKDVSLDLLMEIIQDACLAPSSGNRQTWRFIVINDRDTIERLSEESRTNLVADLDSNPTSYDPTSYVKRYEAALRNPKFNVFYNAPSLVIICGDKHSHSLQVDCALAASYLMLSAAARGLGTCWVDLGARIYDPKLLEEIGLADDQAIVAPVIIGYPKAIPAVPSRNEPIILKTIS
jgi:nitroreductase